MDGNVKKTTTIRGKNNWNKLKLFPNILLAELEKNNWSLSNDQQLEKMLIIDNKTENMKIEIGSKSVANNADGTLLLELIYSNFYDNGKVITDKHSTLIKFSELKSFKLGSWNGKNIYYDEILEKYHNSDLNINFLNNTNKILPKNLKVGNFKIVYTDEVHTGDYCGAIKFTFDAKNYFDGNMWINSWTNQGIIICSKSKYPRSAAMDITHNNCSNVTAEKHWGNQIMLSNLFSWPTLGFYPLICGILVLCNSKNFQPQNRPIAITAGIITMLGFFIIFPGLILGCVLKNSPTDKVSNYSYGENSDDYKKPTTISTTKINDEPILNDKKEIEIIKVLKKEMTEAVSKTDFELAAKLKKMISDLEKNR